MAVHQQWLMSLMSQMVYCNTYRLVLTAVFLAAVVLVNQQSAAAKLGMTQCMSGVNACSRSLMAPPRTALLPSLGIALFVIISIDLSRSSSSACSCFQVLSIKQEHARGDISTRQAEQAGQDKTSEVSQNQQNSIYS